MSVLAQQENLDFEMIKDTFPKNWKFSEKKNYTVTVDEQTVFNGKYSILIASKDDYQALGKTNDFQSIGHYSIPYNFKGKRIKVSAYMKTENVSDQGWGGLYIRVDPFVDFINMRSHNITGTTDWTKYELEVDINDDAYSFSFGAMIADQGKIWVDNFEVYVDGVKFENIPRTTYEREDNWRYHYERAWKVRPTYSDDGTMIIDSTFVHLDKAIAITKKKKLHLKTAILYKFQGDYVAHKDSLTDPKVMESYYHALEFAKKSNKKEDQLKFLRDIAHLHSFTGDYENSIRLREEIIHHLNKVKKQSIADYLVLLKKQNSPLVSFSAVFSELAEDYLKIQNIEMARKYNQMSFDEVNDAKLSAFYKTQFYTKWNVEKEYYILEGKLHLLEGNLDLAKNSFVQAFEVDVKDTTEDELFKIQKVYYLAIVAMKERDYQKTVDLLEQGKPEDLKIFQHHPKYDDYCLLLAKSYSKLKQEKKANAYLENYIDIVERNRKNKNKLTREVQKKEIIQVQEELAQLETSKQSAERRLLYGGGSALLFLMVIGQRFYVTHKRNRKRFKAVLKKLEQKEYQLVLNNTNKSAQIQTEYNLKQELIDALKKGLKRIEKTEYFLRKECTQVTVAKKLKTNTAYLSKFMNSHYGFGFNTYLNNLRIHYAIQRLKNDKTFRSYTVQAISEELGYKSSNTFTKAFKKETGLLPSYYIRELTLLDNRITN
jgi:AraC-like DNA-binding protein